jgi:SAM-dependent methyltransferase
VGVAVDDRLADDLAHWTKVPGFDPLLVLHLFANAAWFRFRGVVDEENVSVVWALLRAGPLVHEGWERALMSMRRALLDVDRPDALSTSLAASLGVQGALNGFIWAVSADEQKAVAGLAKRPETWALVRCAMYQPIEGARGISRLRGAARTMPLKDLLKEQVLDPAEERRLRRGSSLRVGGEVTRRVQSQYEVHPYPRWVSLPGWPSCSPSQWVRLRTGVAVAETPPKTRLLVAGCGTGRHPLMLAKSLRGVRIDAIDLSAASLAIARRQRRQLGLTNVSFHQRDLLQLKGAWDVIESVGVVHHLAEPLEGLRALDRALAPGGLACIGVYTPRGRADVRHARALVAAAGLGPSMAGLRAARALVRRHMAGVHSLTISPDFHSASGFRDLVMHEHEAAWSPAELGAVTSGELGWSFLAVETTGRTRTAFEAIHGPVAAASLEQWEAWEAAHPEVFGGMLIAWFRKPTAQR